MINVIEGTGTLVNEEGEERTLMAGNKNADKGEVLDDSPGRELLIIHLFRLAVKKTDILLQGDRVTICFLSDISREIAWNEVETWQKLIRVLNHEISNSVSPIQVYRIIGR